MMAVARPRPGIDVATETTRLGCIAGLVAAKAADLALTGAVLAARPGAEANPVAAAVYANAGTVGLVVAAIVAVGLTIAGVESAAALARRRMHPGRTAAIVVRLLGYGLVTLLWTAVAINNAQQIAGVLA